MVWHPQQNFFANQIIEFNRFSVKNREIQILFMKFVLLFGSPTYLWSEPFPKLSIERQNYWFQTASAWNFDLRMQLSVQLDFLIAAPDSTTNLSNSNQTKVVIFEFEAAGLIGLSKPAAVLF